MRHWMHGLLAALALVAAGCGRSKVVQELPSPSGNVQAIVRYEPGFADDAYVVALVAAGKKKELTSVSRVLHMAWSDQPETISVFSTPAYWASDTNVYEEVFDLNGARISKQIRGTHGEWKPPQQSDGAPTQEPARSAAP